MKRMLSLTTALTLVAPIAQADSFTDQVTKAFQDLGFEFIEVETGPTQVRVEGLRGRQIYEVIYDRSTGDILTQDVDFADLEDLERSGVVLIAREEDFLDQDDLQEIADEFEDEDDDDDEDAGEEDSDDGDDGADGDEEDKGDVGEKGDDGDDGSEDDDGDDGDDDDEDDDGDDGDDEKDDDD
ncbi:MAG: PepSY domain-containing protein [Pseudomonadota bacterium]